MGSSLSRGKPPFHDPPNRRASVIICAHDRTRYLRDAIASVLAQDVDPSSFELIVVKNFADDECDALVERHGGTQILCHDLPASLKVAAGLRVCRGTIVLLLDDDDLFEPNKLRTVLREFDADATLGFYHHPVSYVGPEGLPLGPKSARPFRFRPDGRARRVLLTKGSRTGGLGWLAYNYPDFNSSSLAIRRDLAVGSLPVLERIDGGVDTFFFFVALISSCSLLLDNVRLTRYRVHHENASLAGGVDREARRARLLASARRQDHVNLVIREMVQASGNTPVLREIDARILITRLSVLFRDQRSGRLDAARALLQGLGLRGTLALRENVTSMVGAALFALVPRLARTTYEHHVSIR